MQELAMLERLCISQGKERIIMHFQNDRLRNKIVILMILEMKKKTSVNINEAEGHHTPVAELNIKNLISKYVQI